MFKQKKINTRKGRITDPLVKKKLCFSRGGAYLKGGRLFSLFGYLGQILLKQYPWKLKRYAQKFNFKGYFIQRFFFVLKNFLKPEENFEKTFFFTKTAKKKKKKKGIFLKFSKNFITSQISEFENRKISSGKPEKEKH